MQLHQGKWTRFKIIKKKKKKCECVNPYIYDLTGCHQIRQEKLETKEYGNLHCSKYAEGLLWLSVALRDACSKTQIKISK